MTTWMWRSLVVMKHGELPELLVPKSFIVILRSLFGYQANFTVMVPSYYSTSSEVALKTH